MTLRSTADAVLQALQPYDLQRQADGSWKLNSPFRPGSNSHGIHLTISGPEHGTWHDHVSGESGSLYDFAKLLGIVTNATPTPVSTSKRAYASLADYEQAHGAPGAYKAAGWSETVMSGRPVLAIPTDNGTRWRFLDGNKPTYQSPTGYTRCWYRLGEALALVSATQQPLVICNGEASTVAGQYHGVAAAAVTSGGEKKLPDTLLKLLIGLYPPQPDHPILIAQDCDAAGQKASQQQYDQLTQAGYPVRALDLNGSSGFDLAEFCALHTTTSVQDLAALNDLPINAAPVTPVSTIAPNDPRPRLETAEMDIPAIAAQAWDALAAINVVITETPVLFRSGTSLCRIEFDTEHKAILVNVEKRRMRSILARTCLFQQTRQGKRGKYIAIIQPPDAIIDDVLVNADERLPKLNRIVRAPVFAADGSLLTTPGYHAQARTYYDPCTGISIPDVPVHPTEAQMLAARTLILEDLLSDFLFVSDADRAHAVALLLLPFVRELISGPTPMHLIEAPTPASGKGLLADVLLYPALGANPVPMAEAGDDDEWRKRITAQLLGGPSAVFIDNLNTTLASGSLAAALTTVEWTDRSLGHSEMITVPVRCAWLATANNPMLSTEIARRCIRIRIDPKMDRPWERSGFKHPQLRQWVQVNQGMLIHAALTLTRYGLQHGQPGRALGSYEPWSLLLGRILHGCGIPDFLGNLDELYERADVQSQAWRALVSAWWDKHHTDEIPAGDVFDILDAEDIDLGLRGKTERALRTAFGLALMKMQDRVLTIPDPNAGSLHLRIECMGTVHNAKLWRLVKV